MKIKSIAVKMGIAVLISPSILFLAIFGYHYVLSRSMLKESIESAANNLALSHVNRIEAMLRPVEKIPQNLVYILENSPSYDVAVIENLLHAVVAENPEIYGATAALEPFAIDDELSEFALQYYKRDGAVQSKDLADEYKYFSRDWYRIPKDLDRALWTGPFFDEGGRDVITAAYSVPLHAPADGREKVIGIVTADVSLSWFKEIIESLEIDGTGYGFLLSEDGTIIMHPAQHLVMTSTVFDIAEDVNDDELRMLGEEMIKGNSGFTLCTDIVTNKKSWYAYAAVSTGWSLGIVFPREEIMADVIKLDRMVLLIGIMGLLFFLAGIIFVSHYITHPILNLHKTTSDIAGGNLDFRLPSTRHADEVGDFAASFVYMRDALKKYIQDLTVTTVDKERMESELRIAHDMQLSLLPKTFPPFPDISEFDIHAVLEPAREVGGDFYDFFFLDNTRLCVVIGDVVGKGVPAALMMAVVKTLINAYSLETKSPKLILDKVNKEFARDNDAGVFVTLFIGILNIKTGHFLYSNGGHNLPLLIKKDKDPVFFGYTDSTVVGLYDDTEYENAGVTLSSGDMLCMYTDGVTEAFNEKGEQFDEERLMDILKAPHSGPVKNIVEDILRRVSSFIGDNPRSDDLTILFLKFN